MAAYTIQLRYRGRNRAESIAGLSNLRACYQRVARSLSLFHSNNLLFWRRDHIVARICERRCTKCDWDRNHCASNRPTAQAARLCHSCHTARL